MNKDEKQQKLIELLRELNEQPGQSILGTVKSVSGNLAVLDVGGRTYSDVRLQAVEMNSEAGVLIVPDRGSVVVAERIQDSDDFLIVKTSKIERLKIVAGSSSIELKDGEILMNDGKQKGLALLDGIVKRMNYQEGLIEELFNLMNTHIHTDPATVTTGPITMPTAKVIQKTKDSDLENKNVKQ